MSLEKTIVLNNKTDAVDTPPAGKIYLYLDGSSLKYKESSGVTNVLSVGVTPEEVQDIIGTFIQSQNNRVTLVYNDASNVLELTLIEGNIVHQNLSGVGTNTHAQIDSHIANTSNPHSVTKTQVGLGNVPNVDATARANHTGTQLSSTISDFASSVIASVLTGFTVGANAAIAATDSIFQAFQKCQGQLDNLFSRVSVLEAGGNGWTELFTTTALTNSSNVTLVNVPALGVSVVAGRRYYLEYTVRFQTVAATTGFGLSIGTSDTAAGTIAAQVNTPIGVDSSTSILGGAITSFGDAVVGTSVPAANVDYIATIRGSFTCTTSGTIVPQFRSEINASQVTFNAGSFVLAREFV